MVQWIRVERIGIGCLKCRFRTEHVCLSFESSNAFHEELIWQAETHKVVHQPVAAYDHDVTPLYTDIIPLRILHRLISRLCSELHRKVESMLHLRRSEDDFSSTDKEEGAIAKIGHQKSRVMEQCEQAR